MDKYDFYTGNSFDAYEFMGAHIVNGGVMFRTYAPNAAAVSVIGELTAGRSSLWSGSIIFMSCSCRGRARG